jgi:hypothetical protein
LFEALCSMTVHRRKPNEVFPDPGSAVTASLSQVVDGDVFGPERLSRKVPPRLPQESEP